MVFPEMVLPFTIPVQVPEPVVVPSANATMGWDAKSANTKSCLVKRVMS